MKGEHFTASATTGYTGERSLWTMLGQTSQIDVVVKEPGELEWRVVLEVLDSEWTRSRAMFLLEEKLNAYAGFILDGQMKTLYAASSPERTHVVVASVDPVPGEAIEMLEKAREVFAAHAVRLSWDAAGGLPKGGTPPPAGYVEGPGGGGG